VSRASVKVSNQRVPAIDRLADDVVGQFDPGAR
jgi:hypothetical protein